MSQYESNQGTSDKSRYEFGSILVKSAKLRMILDEIRQIDLAEIEHLSFAIVGEAGTGKAMMAEYLQKTLYKTKSTIVKKAVEKASELGQTPCIFTTSTQNWVQLRSEVQNHNLKVIVMPTLRERKQDLGDLADFFLKVVSLMNGRPQLKLTEKALEMISQYSWPGQFYEFEAVLEAAHETALKSSSQLMLEPQHLNLNRMPQTFDVTVGMKLEEIERNFILQTLYFVHQNRTKAAEILGISIRTLRNKINQYRGEGYL